MNTEHYIDIAGRDWQQAGLRTWHDKLGNADAEGTDRDMFVYACPGAGKTRFSIAAIKMAAKANAADLVVVIAPTETLRQQWIDETAVHGITLHHYSSDELRQSMADSTIDVNGIITTYAQMSMVPEVFEHWCHSIKVLAVFDEIHHCSDNRTWGTKAEIAFNHASRKIVLSGTPFRSNENERIPFIMHYNAEGNCEVREPDARYGYGEAVNDKVCRIMVFPRLNAEIRFEDDDGVWNGTLDDDTVQPQFRRKLYRAALDAEQCDFPRYMLEQAYNQLKAVRTESQSDAAMLVIARDQQQAKQLQTIMHAMTGHTVPAVMSDEPNSKNIIKRFKKGKQPVIISVKMFAEGVDAPRIRVIAFMSREQTEMWFRQIVGRAVRMQTESHIKGIQEAFMFIPKLPELEAMAIRIEDDIRHIVAARANGGTGGTGGGGGGGTTPQFIVHGSEDERREGFISMAEQFTHSEEVIAENMKVVDPRLARFGTEIVALISKLILGKPDADKHASRFEDIY